MGELQHILYGFFAKLSRIFYLYRDHARICYICLVLLFQASEERNGEYTLTFTYPVSGNYYSDIVEGSIIKAKANETSSLQLFRIYKSSKPINGVVTFYARHISYDMIGLPVKALSSASTTPGAALTSGFNACPISHYFTAWSDISALKAIEVKKPRSLRNLCGGEEGSVLSIWGGEFEFDNFTVKLHSARGSDTGVIIDYGKNLTDAKQERNINDTYTHFCPYAVKTVETKNEAGEVVESHEETVTLTEEVIAFVNPENIGHSKALVLDITDKFEEGEEISEANLRTHAEAYISSHSLGKPKISITFSLMQLWDSPEYASFAALERVRLCDTITVRFPELGINAKAKVIKAEYDSLAERYTKLEVGDAKSTLADTVSSIEENISETKKSVTAGENAASIALNNAIIEATNKITGNSGGYVVLSPANNPQEILIMNTASKSTATKLWRFNLNGLGYSSSGYSGSYGLALTMDGAIVADFITTGTLRAINISACTIVGGSLNINDKFTVDTSGNASVEGYIKATSGIIGGCNIVNGVLDIPAVNVSGTLTAAHIDVSGVITAGAANIETIIAGKVTASYVEALSINVAAANVTGTLTASQIDVAGIISAGGIAIQNDIPTEVSELTNDSGYTNATGVITLIDGRITADYIEALSIKVGAAQITGTLTASQINANGITASGVTISGAITATSGSIQDMLITGMLKFGGNQNYYINANYNDGSYYLNLPGLKIDAASGAVFSGTLSAATGTFAGSLNAATGTFSGSLSAATGSFAGSLSAATGTIGISTYPFNIGTGSDSSNSPCIYSRANYFSGIGGFGVIADNYVYIGGDGFSYWGGSSNTFDYNTAIRPGGCFCSGDNNGQQAQNRATLLRNGGVEFFYGGYTNLRSASYSTLQSKRIAFMDIRSTDVLLSGTFMGSSSGSIVSDRNLKNSIESIPDTYETLFDSLIPRIYKYNDGTSGRIHAGMIAQEVKAAMESAGIPSMEFAAYIESVDLDGNTVCGLRYEEFIALCINEIQKLKARVTELEG